MRLAAVLLVAAAVGCVGCNLEPRPIPCSTWESHDAAGRCHLRAFTLPAAGDALGDAGARDVQAVIDSRGHGLLAFGSSAGLELLEEGAPGQWTRRLAGQAVQGTIPSDLVAGPDGTAAFAYLRADESNLSVFLSERDPSGQWREPASTAEAFSFPTTAYAPRLAVNRGGEWLLVWNQWMSTPDYGVAVARRAPGQTAWTRPADRDDVLSPRIFFSNTPVVALNDAGQAIITWYQSVGGPLMAFVSERPGTKAAFSHPSPGEFLSAPGGAVDSDPVAAVKPALYADGSAAVAWTQENGKGATLVYLATRDARGRWTKPASLDDAFSIPLGYARGVQLAFGPKGDLYLAWYQDAGDGSAVYAARRGADGTWAEDGRHPLRLSSPGAQGFFPRFAVGPDGGALFTWQERAGSAGPMRVAARRTGRAGDPWGPIELLSPVTGDDAVHPAAAVGAGNRAIVAWGQGPGPAMRIYAARVEL